MNKLEESKLIAEFMGLHVYSGISPSGEKYYYYNNSALQDFEGLPSYKTCWNALMEVVEHIESLESNNSISIHWHGTYINSFKGTVDIKGKVTNGSRLDHTYDAVIKFINKHNNIK